MTIVVDASIELKWVLEERGSDAAEELLEKDLAARAAPQAFAASSNHSQGAHIGIVID